MRRRKCVLQLSSFQHSTFMSASIVLEMNYELRCDEIEISKCFALCMHRYSCKVSSDNHKNKNEPIFEIEQKRSKTKDIFILEDDQEIV